MNFATVGIAYLVLMNALGYAAFAWDKHCAVRGLRRVSERDLLTLAVIGGSMGLIVGQRTLRHKTRKEPFRSWLLGITGIQLLLLIAVSFT